MLRIENLHAAVDGKPILKGLTFVIGATGPCGRPGGGCRARELLGVGLEGSAR